MTRPLRLRIVHLFPDLLNVYGDGGNVQTLVARGRARGVSVDVDAVRYGDRRIPAADLYLIGGGQDREQITVGSELERFGAELTARVDEAALLAVCGGYQNLGRTIRTPNGEIRGPGVMPIATDARPRGPRLVGPILVSSPAPIAAIGEASARAAGCAGAELTIVGFENHGGRTFLDTGVEALGLVEIGHGNNGSDRTEGVAACLGPDGLPRRVGTYLHGPLLPRNPHLADALLMVALSHDGPAPELRPLDDRLEWLAHARFVARLRTSAAADRRLPGWAHRVVDPVRGLIGF
jgi:CobQ-like glutamine amidotransferase family enzyme